MNITYETHSALFSKIERCALANGLSAGLVYNYPDFDPDMAGKLCKGFHIWSTTDQVERYYILIERRSVVAYAFNGQGYTALGHSGSPKDIDQMVRECLVMVLEHRIKLNW